MYLSPKSQVKEPWKPWPNLYCKGLRIIQMWMLNTDIWITDFIMLLANNWRDTAGQTL